MMRDSAADAEVAEDFDLDFDAEGELVVEGAPDGFHGGFYSTDGIHAAGDAPDGKDGR